MVWHASVLSFGEREGSVLGLVAGCVPVLHALGSIGVPLTPQVCC